MGTRSSAPRWSQSPARAELLALYAEADALAEGWTCACSDETSCAPPSPGEAPASRCCLFGVTGREPYPTAVELEEVRHGMRTSGVVPSRRLPLVELRPCPLLSESGRCRIYASRPFGCRTFFCREAQAPFGARVKRPRDAVNAVGRRIADLSARFAPHDPHPRALTKSLP
jgi:Fe-S-cluster containining protein